MNAKWIWIDSLQIPKPRMVYFKKNIEISEILSDCVIRVYADSRYVLTINDKRVATGPCRAPKGIRYYDSLNVTDYLKKGHNEIFIKAIQYTDHKQDCILFKTGPASITTEGLGGLKIEEIDTDYGISTSSEYLCLEESGYQFPEDQIFGYISFSEYFDNSENYSHKEDSDWQSSIELFKAPTKGIGALRDFWYSIQRIIPMPYEKIDCFHKINVNTFNIVDNKFIIQSDSVASIELDALRLINAYPRLIITCGKGSVIKITYAEGYSSIIDNNIVKGIRDKAEGQDISGFYDIYIAHQGRQQYIPVNYRNFRVVKIEVIAKGDVPFIIESIDYIKTGYPLDISASFKCDDDNFTDIWNISKRTLLRCMYDTYMDCPYYEQMQYIMDTYLEIQYTFSISSDSMLARKAILDFAQAQLPDGLLPCNSPSKFNQIIPGFPFYWILMLESYMMYVGDINFIKSNLSTADKLIQFYVGHINENNLLGDTGYWQFFDWVKEWRDGSPVCDGEINILYNMLFVYGLRAAAKLNRFCNRNCIADEYEELAKKISDAINTFAFDEELGLYSDTPGKKPSSQHAQIFAVLSSVVPCDKKQKIMKNMFEHIECLSKVSYCFSYFLCRALEETNLYYELFETLGLWDMYIELMQYNLTTWPEDFVTMRSDCHGWSAIALYEIPACFLGIKPLEPGYQKVLIKPYVVPLNSYSGKVPIGDNKFIEISIKKDINNKHFIDIKVPSGVEYELDLSQFNNYDFMVARNDD